MINLTDFLSKTKTLEEVESSINGKLTVVKDLTWGTYIKAGGLTQSGGVAAKVWQSTLRKIHSSQLAIKNVLILGLGGGSIAKLVCESWPAAKITGVDIDPVIVELGKKYLGMEEKRVKVVIADAGKAIASPKYNIRNKKYDLICIDIYLGDKYPKKFEKIEFINSINRLIRSGGVAIFNRLYYDEKRKETEKFEKKLEKVFPNVERFYPEANVMFVCK